MGVNKIAFGNRTLIDLTNDSATPETTFQGVKAHGKDGNSFTGTFTIENELTEQGSLIARLRTALQGKAVDGGGITPTGTIQITKNGSYDVTSYAGANVNVPEKPTQEKSVEITENGSVEIVPDNGKVLSKVGVSVNVPIPDGYIKPSGTLKVTANGTHNAKQYESVEVNVPTGGGGGEEDVAAILGNTMTELNNSIVTSLRNRACQGATALVSVNLPNVTSLGSYAFYQCSGLVTIKLPKLTAVATQTFYGCTKLKHADCGQLGNIPAQTFNACSALTELILRKTGSICTLSNVNGVNNSPIGKGTGYVYVPAALIDAYKTATNWSTFANQFRAIEDYPDVCG